MTEGKDCGSLAVSCLLNSLVFLPRVSTFSVCGSERRVDLNAMCLSRVCPAEVAISSSSSMLLGNKRELGLVLPLGLSWGQHGAPEPWEDFQVGSVCVEAGAQPWPASVWASTYDVLWLQG